MVLERRTAYRAVSVLCDPLLTIGFCKSPATQVRASGMKVTRKFHLTEIVEDSHALHLLHLAVEAAQGNTRPKAFECFMKEADLLAGGHEDNHLALQHTCGLQTTCPVVHVDDESVAQSKAGCIRRTAEP